MSNPADWRSVNEAADIYQVHPRTIRRMISRGEIIARRLGPRLIRVDLASVERAMRPMQYGGGE